MAYVTESEKARETALFDVRSTYSVSHLKLVSAVTDLSNADIELVTALVNRLNETYGLSSQNDDD